MDVEATKALICETESQIVINVGSAFLSMSVLRACIDTGAAYLDTAIREEPGKICETPPWYGATSGSTWPECREKGITAILGAGRPGVVNAYAALAQQEYFDKIESIDILDVNAGSHGRVFRRQFRPGNQFPRIHRAGLQLAERPVDDQPHVRVKRTDDLPVVGEQNLYLTGHDEVHSLSSTSTCRTSVSG